MRQIVQKDHPALREIAKPVPIEQIGSAKIAGIIEDMKAALGRESDGVAIAAPQVGEPLRIFVVSGRIFSKSFNAPPGEEKQFEDDVTYPDLVFINPEIVKKSKTTALMEEGCLSVRWLYGRVRRSTKATIRAYDEKGRLFTRGASGLLAQIFQHETDHLVGTLFTDSAKDVREILPE